MTALKKRMVSQIEALGPLPVHEYMATCLFDPRDGYYTTRQPFGADGDFTTAPEISQMFGELIGAWLVATWRQIGSPQDPIIAEIGPGRGALMKDIARTISRLAPALSANASFALIEASPRLSDVQRETLANSHGTFNWIASVAELPGRPLLIIGNELFDAIPCRQYVKTAQGWRERYVDITAGGDLTFAAGVGSLDPSLLPPEASGAPQGAIFEIAPARTALLQQIAEHIATHSGAGLFLDYGHLQPGIGDTLQAVLKHKYNDPLAHPGEADLTSHVDFAALANTVRQTGLTPHLTTQGDFLLALGLVERAGALGANADDTTRARLTSDANRLAGPDEMGELFKVLGFQSTPGNPPGF